LFGYATQYGLDGAEDTICLLVADIRHQGRAKSPAIVLALQSSKPLESLLALGEPKYHERVVVLRQEIKKLVAEGTLGTQYVQHFQERFCRKVATIAYAQAN